jgi:site-specific DNA-cytosine methylase
MNLNISSEVTQTLDLVQVPVLFNYQPVVSSNWQGSAEQGSAEQGSAEQGDVGDTRSTVLVAPTPDLAVRRLTPSECEALMGWPKNWTRWADDGTEIADSHRYKMCGNGVVAPVAEWIGRRLP